MAVIEAISSKASLKTIINIQSYGSQNINIDIKKQK